MSYRSLLSVIMILFVFCQKTNFPPDGAVRVNGEWIKKQEIEKTAEVFRQEMLRVSAGDEISGISDNLRKKTAKQLIAQELFLQEAKKRGISCEGERCDSLIDRFKRQFGSDSVFQMLLLESGQTEEKFSQQIREGYMVDSIVKIFVKDIKDATTDECRKYYDENTKKFEENGKIKASQIFLGFGSDTSEQIKKTLTAKMEPIYREAKSGKDFAALARKYSKGPNAKNGGDIGWFKRGDLMPELEDPLFTLKKGEISPIIESKIGMHILKKTDEMSGGIRPFDKAEWLIRDMLTDKKKKREVERVVDSIMATSEIVYADTTYKP